MHARTALLVCLPLVLVSCAGELGEGDGVTTDGAPSDGSSSETSSDDDTGSPAEDTASTPDTGSPKPDTTPPPVDTAPSDPVEAARSICVDEINKYRATLGLAPLTRWKSAETCGDSQSKSDSETGKAHGAFGKCGESAQNECPGWPGPPDTMIKGCLKMMWAEGPGANFSTHGHYLNMSNKSFTTVACGFYKTPSGSWWSVQDFR